MVRSGGARLVSGVDSIDDDDEDEVNEQPVKVTISFIKSLGIVKFGEIAK